MLYMEIIAACSQIHTKHINTLCGQNVELLNVNWEPVSTPSIGHHQAIIKRTLTLILLTWRIW